MLIQQMILSNFKSAPLLSLFSKLLLYYWKLFDFTLEIGSKN